MNLNDQTKQVLLIIVVLGILFFFLYRRREGYERVAIGGSYGKVQNEMLWYPYPQQPLPRPGTRHAKYSPCGKLHSSSYVHPDFNTTINEPHGCRAIPNAPAFRGEDVKSYQCPQPKVYNSGR